MQTWKLSNMPWQRLRRPGGDSGTDGDFYYYTMPLIQGKTFGHWAEGKTLLSILPVMEQVCAAIAFAHRQGVLHRDLKPENLLLSHKGPGAEVKITDFGLSKMFAPDGCEQEVCMIANTTT